jgi:nitrogenase iron protein NifH
MKTAIYGKGGIGKSTVTANLAAALASTGQAVLQIGCDPKRDSTRLLLDGRTVPTVLDILRTTRPDARSLGALLHRGYGGVDCVEAGGPEPGVGCAGRGILSTFETLDALGLDMGQYGAILYDVLGDVVCGGFAVPLRKGFADRVVIVTSEEFLALYAANNILRGVRNFHGAAPRMAGLILNSRGENESDAGVLRFAEATGLRVLARLPRSQLFRKAEARGQTVIQAFSDTPLADTLRDLANAVAAPEAMAPARPLDDADLERLLLDRTVASISRPLATEPNEEYDRGCKAAAVSPKHSDEPVRPERPPRFLSKSMRLREPLHGCAFAGAVATLTQVGDAVTLAHGPRSCTHIAEQALLSAGTQVLRRDGRAVPELMHPRLMSTDMGEDGMVFGGGPYLSETLEQALSGTPGAVFVTTTCPAGVIGDDADAEMEKAGFISDVPLLRVDTDGDMAGDYLQGIINACVHGAGGLIDDRIAPEDGFVNVVAEKNIASNAESNFACVRDLLAELGLCVHCRFVRRTTVEALRTFRKASLNLLAYGDTLGRALRDYLSDTHDARFADQPFPVGLHETIRWIEGIGEKTDRADRVQLLAASLRARFARHAAALRPTLSGKRLFLVAYNHDLDWILETAFEVGMEVVKVAILNYSQDDLLQSRFRDRVDFETGYDPSKREADIATLHPDLVLCNYVPHGLAPVCHYDGIPLCPDVGPGGALALARRWTRILKTPLMEDWRNDGPKAEAGS